MYMYVYQCRPRIRCKSYGCTYMYESVINIKVYILCLHIACYIMDVYFTSIYKHVVTYMV